MEEILASIRRIIADDDPSASAQASAPDESPVPPPGRPTASPQPPITQAAGGAAVPLREPSKAEVDALLAQLHEPFQQTRHPEEPASDIRGEERRPQPASFATSDDRSSRGLEERPRARSPGNEADLISAATSAQVGSAFNRLAQAVAAPKGPTLEELVSEMLRPMLKAWLDEKLPAMVERLVQAEIERVSRKG
jgi:uncharacterized protein